MGELRVSKSHEWVRIEGDVGTVGITDYAQKELGDIVFIELPSIGDMLIQGEKLGTIESTKAASELYSPVSGEVIEVNEELNSSPQYINEDAFGRGWMVTVKVKDVSELAALMDEPTYQEFIEKEKH